MISIEGLWRLWVGYFLDQRLRRRACQRICRPHDRPCLLQRTTISNKRNGLSRHEATGLLYNYPL